MTSDLRILLAEDNDVNQHLMLRILTRIGYDAVLAKTGIQVLNKMDRQDFDVILMDIQMPDMDGLTATRLIRMHYPAEKQPRIIALTAETSPEGREKYLAAGMNDMLSKPVQIEALIEVLGSTPLKPSESIQELVPEKKSSALNEFASLDTSVLQEFVTLLGEEGRDSAKHLIELYKNGTPGLVAQIEQASESKNLDELLRLLHSLKGSSSQVGARRMEQLCSRLEVLLKRSGIETFATFLPGIQQEYRELTKALDEYIAGLS